MSLGILFAILAALTWALGDFMIEKTSRKAGSTSTLFYITLFGSIVFLPFIWSDIPMIRFDTHLWLFILSSLVFLFSAFFDFQALKVGKISVVEPICSFEVPITALIAFIVLGERLLPFQIGLIAVTVAGIFLVVTKDFSVFKHVHKEKGVWLAVLATLGMGGSNFLFAQSARLTSPLLIMWFSSVFILIIVSVYLFTTGGFKKLLKEAQNNKGIVTALVTADNFSWVFYTYAALTLPIAIAIGISESYVALAALLGLIYNKEKLRPHQFAGMAICIIAVIVLSTTLK